MKSGDRAWVVYVGEHESVRLLERRGLNWLVLMRGVPCEIQAWRVLPIRRDGSMLH